MSRLLSRCRNGNRRADHSQVAKKTVRVENGVRVLLAREHTVRRSSGSKGHTRPLSEAVSGGSGARRGASSEAWPRQAREAFPYRGVGSARGGSSGGHRGGLPLPAAPRPLGQLRGGGLAEARGLGRAGGEDRLRARDAEGVVEDLPSHPICGYSCVSGRDLELASRGRSRMVGRRVKTNGEVT